MIETRIAVSSEAVPMTVPQTGTVIDFVLRDHRVLRDEIAHLKSASLPGPEMRPCLLRFLRVLRAHTVAEEGALLTVMENFRPQRVRVLEAFDEHDLHETLEEQVHLLLRETPEWSEALQAKTKVLAEAVEHHLDEEEKLIDAARQLISHHELHELRGPYARLRRATLEKQPGSLE